MDAPNSRKVLPFRPRSTSRYVALNALCTTLLILIINFITKLVKFFNVYKNKFLTNTQNRGMIIIFIRSTTIFLTLLIVMRLMGKRQIGEMQPFELVITLLISELACIPMADVSIPLLYGITAIIAIFILHQLISLIEQSSQTAKKIISGKPSLVLNKNGVDFYELKQNNMGVDDLIESMRSAGFYSLDDLDYAIFESNGKLSTKEKQGYDKKKSALPLVVINDGKIVNKNLEILQIKKDELIKIVQSRNCKSIKRVGIMTIDGDGKIYFQKLKGKYEVFNVKLKEGVQW